MSHRFPPVWPARFRSREFTFALSVLAVSTLIALALRAHLAATNLAMLYLLGVVAIAMRCTTPVSLIASVAGVAAFDFFCVPPYYTLRVSDYEYLLTFAGMLVVARVISTQTERIRKQAAEAAASETRNQTLLLSRRLAGPTSVADVARIAVECATEVFEGQAGILLAEDGRIRFERCSADAGAVEKLEAGAALWAFEHGEKAGRGTGAMAGCAALYIPLRGTRETAGVMRLWPAGGELSPGQLQLLEVLANQAANAIERAHSQQAADAVRIQIQTEQMRSSLLSAVSHDLRTPLASITGAASTLCSQGEKLPPEMRRELLESIADEADRLSRLVGNLLDMTRLESGVELRRGLCPLEEIVGSALQRMEHQLGSRPVRTDLPASLPPIYVDDVLLGQLIVNLLDNAIKYTPEGTPIELAAEATGETITLEVRDRGPGFTQQEEQRVFERFYRGNSVGKRGVGLGLAICKAIAEAHQGTIGAHNRPGGGAIFQIRLPVGGAS